MGQNDVEKGNAFYRETVPSPDYNSSVGGDPSYEETTILRRTWPHRMIDSFKRDPSLTMTPKGVIGVDGRVFDPHTAVSDNQRESLLISA
jgi:amino acid transporter